MGCQPACMHILQSSNNHVVDHAGRACSRGAALAGIEDAGHALVVVGSQLLHIREWTAETRRRHARLEAAGWRLQLLRWPVHARVHHARPGMVLLRCRVPRRVHGAVRLCLVVRAASRAAQWEGSRGCRRDCRMALLGSCPLCPICWFPLPCLPACSKSSPRQLATFKGA